MYAVYVINVTKNDMYMYLNFNIYVRFIISN